MRLYEDLVGAFGTKIHFRVNRTKVKELLPQGVNLQMVVDDVSYPVIELDGHSLLLNVTGSTPNWGETTIDIQLQGVSVGRGKAHMTDIDPSSITAIFSLLGWVFDLQGLTHQYEESVLSNELRGGASRIRDLVPEKFRNAVDKAAHFLHHYKAVLDRHEDRIRRTGRGSIPELLEQAHAEILKQWTAIDAEASNEAWGFMGDRATVKAAKLYTERMVTPLLMGAPMYNRSYNKPLGYPGDYQVMVYSYDNLFLGDSVFNQVFHKIVTDHPLAYGIRTRKDLMVEKMYQEHDLAISQERAFHAMSLGCGPAREVLEYIEKRRTWPGKAVWTLIDQERETLDVAYRNGNAALARHRASGDLNCFNLSFGQLLADISLLKEAPEQDFIYCVGLFDYLKEEKAQQVANTLFSFLKPGGLLAIGNAIGPNPHFWTLEFILDWSLKYRNREDIARFGAMLPSTTQIEVVVEKSESYAFMLARK